MTFVSFQMKKAKALEEGKKEWIPHLTLREGCVLEVYKDSLGKDTVGVGHLVVPSDNLSYGDKISQEVCDKFLEKDSESAWQAANTQAEIIGCTAMHFIQALASVCFQLGNSWNLVHKKTWTYLCAHEWDLAAEEVEDSKWYRQTPVRVEDFQEAIIKNKNLKHLIAQY